MKLMRDIDIERLNSQKTGKIVTESDWMLAALLALNSAENNSQTSQKL